jgi:hypothetical protein
MSVDANLETMQRTLVEFAGRIKPGATAMVYYAGHGIQANGRNYLLPIDARFESESALRFEALEVADILEDLENSRSRINLVVLDACRNNPFERRVRGGGRGLAVIDASAGSLIAYATAPGSVASDGDGRNGLYTGALLAALDMPGLKVEDVFKQVRIKVSRRSNGQQVPWESSSLTADFIFNPDPAAETPVPVPVVKSDQPDGHCADISGDWISRSAAAKCDSSLTFTKTGPKTYDMVLFACSVPLMNKVSGTTVVENNVMTTRWAGTGCTGVTTMILDDTCTSASGEAVFNPSMLCKGTYKETLHYVSDAPGS